MGHPGPEGHAFRVRTLALEPEDFCSQPHKMGGFLTSRDLSFLPCKMGVMRLILCIKCDF